jgi:hypothetical protein
MSEWKEPYSEIRKILTLDINDILLELEDCGYRTHLAGFIDKPYVWIKNPKGNLDMTIVDEIVERLKSYFDTNFSITDIRKINNNQVYIYFYKN